MAKSPSIVSMARGGMYIATTVIPAKVAYEQLLPLTGGDKMAALQATVKSFGGINHQTGKFDWEVIAQMYGPVATWTIIDMLASRFGVWRKMGRLIGSFKIGG